MVSEINTLKGKLATLQQELDEANRQLQCERAKSHEFETIIASIPGHVYWVDKDGVILGCNAKQAKSLGYNSSHEVVGKNVYDVQPKEQADEILLNNSQIIRNKKDKLVEEAAVLANGDEKMFLSHKAPLYGKRRKIIGVIGIATDVTELKSRQDQLRQNELTLENIIALMPGNIYWKNSKGQFLGCNNNVARILNLSGPKDIIGKTNYDLFDAGLAKQAEQADNTAMNARHEHVLEEQGLDLQGNITTYLTRKVPLFDEQHNVIGMLGVSLDISERKRIEEELQRAKEAAEVANQAKTEFVLNMEHDLRTPVSGIYGLTKVLAGRVRDKILQDQLALVAGAADELLQILNDILRFHQIESGGFAVMAKSLSVRKLIERIVTLELAPAQDKGLKLTYTIDKKLPEIVLGDEYRLYRIVLNLVSNAIKFTAKGSVKITVTVAKQLDTRNIVLSFVVQDTGIGIAAEKQDVIYEKFSRLELSNTGRYKGLGLGLHIVRQFVQELDGDIKVESSLGKGATFTCALPFKLPLLDD